MAYRSKCRIANVNVEPGNFCIGLIEKFCKTAEIKIKTVGIKNLIILLSVVVSTARPNV